jgi:uncharacterized protein YdaU (DUF1376 family)
MKAPAFQFYPKQWLGDDKVLAMDWDARAMHMHLMCIAWQQTPPCTLPDDDDMIRRWLGNPKKWKLLKNQILSAWKMDDGRWVQSGLLEQFKKQDAYRESRKSGANARWGNDAHASSDGCITDALHSSSSSSSSSVIPYETPNGVSCLELEIPPVEVLVYLPLNDKSEFGITEKMVNEWKVLYPSVDILQQCRSMKGWCISHPRQLKTRTGIMKFIMGWLSREQDKGPHNRNGGNRNGQSFDRNVNSENSVIRRLEERRLEEESYPQLNGFDLLDAPAGAN